MVERDRKEERRVAPVRCREQEQTERRVGLSGRASGRLSTPGSAAIKRETRAPSRSFSTSHMPSTVTIHVHPPLRVPLAPLAPVAPSPFITTPIGATSVSVLDGDAPINVAPLCAGSSSFFLFSSFALFIIFLRAPCLHEKELCCQVQQLTPLCINRSCSVWILLALEGKKGNLAFLAFFFAFLLCSAVPPLRFLPHIFFFPAFSLSRVSLLLSHS